MHETAPETSHNTLLRSVDWRFLLRQEDVPRTLDLTSGKLSAALPLVTEPAAEESSGADLVVVDSLTAASLRRARRALRPGGEVVCLWSDRWPAAVQTVRRRLQRLGFADPAFYWPGPDRSRDPEFWLPLNCRAGIDHVFSQRPPRSRREALSRLTWRLAARAGAVAPVYAIARLATADESPSAEAQADPLSGDEPWVLLTHGSDSGSKVVGLPFHAGRSEPETAMKVGREAEADRALDREAEALREIERTRPALTGVPRLRATGTRAGRRAIVQDAMRGRPLHLSLSASTFAEVAIEMTDWLATLAGSPAPQPASAWAQRLVYEPLEELERDFAALVPTNFPERARRALAGLGELPLVWEHRDLGHWNVVAAESGGLAVFDWEHAEREGLPGLDLTWFLISSGLMVDGATATGNTDRIRASYAGLLDPSTALGKAVASSFAEYASRTGFDAAEFGRLRLLCWVVQALILYRQEPADRGFFIDLAEDELKRLEDQS